MKVPEPPIVGRPVGRSGSTAVRQTDVLGLRATKSIADTAVPPADRRRWHIEVSQSQQRDCRSTGPVRSGGSPDQ